MLLLLPRHLLQILTPAWFIVGMIAVCYHEGALFSYSTEFPMYFPGIKRGDRLLPLQWVDPRDRRLNDVLKELGVSYVVTSSLWSYQADATGRDPVSTQKRAPHCL